MIYFQEREMFDTYQKTNKSGKDILWKRINFVCFFLLFRLKWHNNAWHIQFCKCFFLFVLSATFRWKFIENGSVILFFVEGNQSFLLLFRIQVRLTKPFIKKKFSIIVVVVVVFIYDDNKFFSLFPFQKWLHLC